MEVGAVAKNLETLTLFDGPVPKARIPSQGHDDRAAIRKLDFQGVIGHSRGSSARFLDFNG